MKNRVDVPAEGITRFGQSTTIRPPAGAAKALREWIACERDAGREPFR